MTNFSINPGQIILGEKETDTFTIVLTEQPTETIILTLANSDATEVTLSTNTLTFTTENWSDPQTVTLTGIDDQVADGTQLSIMTVTSNVIVNQNQTGNVASQALAIYVTDSSAGTLSPIEDESILQINDLASANTISFDMSQLSIENASEVIIYSVDSLGQNPAEIERFSVIDTSGLPGAFSPTFSIDADLISAGQYLKVEIVEDGEVRTATLSRNQDGTISIDFGNGTVIIGSLTNSTATTNLLSQDADAIDLTGQTGSVGVVFSVYREADFNNTVGLYQTDTASGGIVDPLTGNTLNPGDAGYKEAALARQLDVSLTGVNGQISTFSAEITGGSYLGTFLIVNGSDAATSEVYFGHAGANTTGDSHVKLLGNNTFGFEDQAGLGDADFDDVVVQFAVV